MVNEERLKSMIKMAIFDKNEGNKCRPMIYYTRSDYTAMQLMGSFFTGTAAFIIFFIIWALYHMEELLKMLNLTDIMEFLMKISMFYVIFLIVYLLITYVVYQIKYTKGRKKIKKYHSSLKKINKQYLREEKLKSPVGKDLE